MPGIDEVKPIRVAIVAPVHNRRELTLQCLRSLSRVERTGLEISIFIVDDGCTDGTRNAIEQNFPDVNVVHGTGDLWYTAGTNLGIHAALKHDPDYVLCINDDSIFDEACIKHLVDRASRTPRSVVGGLLLLWNTPHRVFQVAPIWKTAKGGWQHWYQQTIWTIPQTSWEVEMIVGNCVLYPVAVFKEAGFLRPQVSAQYGDAEFTTRLRKLGWRLVIEPRARVFCQPNYEHVSLTSRPLRQQIDAFFLNKRSAMNIPHQFRQSIHTAPNKAAGFAGFLAFYFHVLRRKLIGRQPVIPTTEDKLSRLFAEKIVKDRGE